MTLSEALAAALPSNGERGGLRLAVSQPDMAMIAVQSRGTVRVWYRGEWRNPKFIAPTVDWKPLGGTKL